MLITPHLTSITSGVIDIRRFVSSAVVGNELVLASRDHTYAASTITTRMFNLSFYTYVKFPSSLSNFYDRG